MMLVAQRADLRSLDAEEGEHALLGADEAEVALRTVFGQAFDQLMTQARDALAHRPDFPGPLLAQSWITEDFQDDGGAMVRRHGIDAARDADEVTEDRVTLRGSLGDHV